MKILHVRADFPDEEFLSLCGKDITSFNFSKEDWDFPEDFIGTLEYFRKWSLCEECSKHPRVQLALLANIKI